MHTQKELGLVAVLYTDIFVTSELFFRELCSRKIRESNFPLTNSVENVIFLDFKKEKIIDFSRRILLLIARVFLHHLEGKWNVMETLLSAKKIV